MAPAQGTRTRDTGVAGFAESTQRAVGILRQSRVAFWSLSRLYDVEQPMSTEGWPADVYGTVGR